MILRIWISVSVVFLLALFSVRLLGAINSLHRQDVFRTDRNTPVRVLLAKGVPTLTLQSLGNRALFVRPEKLRKWYKFTAPVEIKVVPYKKKTIFQVNKLRFSSRRLFIRGKKKLNTLRVMGASYRGVLILHRVENSILVVNSLPMQKYLEGTLASEMNANWTLEALKTQAVASRTYASYMQAHPKSTMYDLENTTRDQVYSGADVETPRVKKAIEQTKATILTKDKKPIKAYYHSRCGGHTDYASQVWRGKRPSTVTPIPCPFCQKNPRAWKYSIPTSTLLAKLSLPHNKGKLRLRSVSQTQTGRSLKIAVDSGGKTRTISTERLRSLLGHTRLKSARFASSINRGQVTFRGVGSGHGVGLCQWGAYHLAQQGKSFKEILAHYYPSAKLKTIGQLPQTKKRRNRRAVKRFRLSRPTRPHRHRTTRTARPVPAVKSRPKKGRTRTP